jgi:hypothetical protein
MRASGVPHIIGKLSMKGKTLPKPHLNQRFAQEVMGVQNGGNPNLKNFKIFDLGVLKKMIFGCSSYG